MRPFRLSRQLLRRDWRSGELRTLVFALVTAVAAVACIGLVTERLGEAMTRESAELIGGDLVVDSTRQQNPEWLAMGQALGMETARVVTLNSVLFHGDAMLLSGVKAVTESYPLRGELRISGSPTGQATATRDIPTPGTAWVDPRVLTRLNAAVGDSVHFGATTLRIAQVLRHEPDQGNNLFQMAPRVLINIRDLEPAQVLGPGSRAHYQYLFAGENAATLKERLAPLMATGHELVDPLEREGRATNALLDALEFVKMAALLAIVLAAIAIALAARRYSEHHYDVSAMLRCLGAQQRHITRLYLYQLGLLTGAAVAVGCGLGWGTHCLLVTALDSILQVRLPAPSPAPLVSAAATALLLTAGFALPPVVRLARVPPLRVFRRELSPMPVAGWLVYGAALLALLAIAAVLFRDMETILTVLILAVAGIAAIGALIYALLVRLRRSRLTRNALFGRSLRNLTGHPATSTSQVLAFGLALMIIVLVGQLRTELLEDWRVQLPEKVPNYFAFNIQPADLEAFRQLTAKADQQKPFYPIVRGRLTAVKGEPVGSSEATETNRELNLTWTDELPADNEIVEGTWPPKGDGVSIEADYAERLGVGLGDRLTFNTGGQPFEARVTSLRTVVWESFSPNFFLIFSRETLAPMPTTYLTSFRLDSDRQSLVPKLLRQFPAVTVIEVDALLARLQEILAQVSLAVETMMVFVVLGGLAVLFAAIVTTTDDRLREGALMRALGASRRYLRRAFVAEFALLGLVAGLVGMLGADIAGAALYRYAFDMAYSLDPRRWLLVPAAAAAGIGLAGYLGTRRVVSVSPARLLQ